MEFKPNQKVRVKQLTRNDGTCSGSCAGCGTVIAQQGDEGFVKEITEFLFEPVVVVHFLETGKVIGFREKELDIIEDYDDEELCWIPVAKGA